MYLEQMAISGQTSSISVDNNNNNNLKILLAIFAIITLSLSSVEH